MGDTIIECGKGHVRWGTWVLGASVTTIKLGPRRLGWCPVGRHVSLLRRTDESQLTPAQRRELFGDT
ncbi:hypothetical protein [Streptomyces sp. URMC 124]|uniref:hypothetical protein n=1 Tax=Streptomyces sp. URMC 124 TaxID=3423405 RepID=UPI003F1C953D